MPGVGFWRRPAAAGGSCADGCVYNPVPAAGVVVVKLVREGHALLFYIDGFAYGHCVFEELGDRAGLLVGAFGAVVGGEGGARGWEEG